MFASILLASVTVAATHALTANNRYSLAMVRLLVGSRSQSRAFLQ